MKIDRLLAITIYLLNHKKVSAHTLAKRFEVSQRTIIRDMNSLCLAGIPIISTYGADGGYELPDTFKMERQVAGAGDYSYIVTALKGLSTAYNSKELNATLQKIQAVSKGTQTNMILDFSVLKEKKTINNKLSALEEAVKIKHIITFSYTNADNGLKSFEVEPIAVIYKWYSWYLLSYFPKYQDYGIFKLERMDNIKITEQKNSLEHDADYALSQWESKEDTRRYLSIKLYCKSEVKVKCMEYLNGEIERELENGDIIVNLFVPENEQFWYGLLLSFGNNIKILEPKELYQRICRTCQDILKEYKDI